MQPFVTITIAAETTYTIFEAQKVVQFALEVFTMTGNSKVPAYNQPMGNYTQSSPINVGSVAGSGTYSSPTLTNERYWDSITISVSAGSVSLVLITD